MAVFCLSRGLARVGYPQSYPQHKDARFLLNNNWLHALFENYVKKYPLTCG